jgi:hypothetical protein
MYFITLNGNYLLMDNNLELCKSLFVHNNKKVLNAKVWIIAP